MKNTTLIYLEQDQKYLMLHRTKKENDINHDKWIGVGGKMEENESPEEGAIREILEETGLTVLPENLHYRGLVTFVSDQSEGEYMHLFTAEQFSGTRKDCNEGDLCWVPKEKVLSLPTWEGDQLFLNRIAEPSPFFVMKLVYVGDKLVFSSVKNV